MLDIKLLRTDPELVKANIRKKFQDHKLPLVDEVVDMDRLLREAKTRGDELRNLRNTVSKEIGILMAKGRSDEAEKSKSRVTEIAGELAALKETEEDLTSKIRERMLVIPNLIDAQVPIGKDDGENVEVERFGETLRFGL
jgi:seryl-tRNA synthetase